MQNRLFPGWILFVLLILGVVLEGKGQVPAQVPAVETARGPGSDPGADSRSGFRVLVVASRARDHLAMIAAAKPMFEKMAADNHFTLDFTNDTSRINDVNLANYQVFVMLHLAPFDMSGSQQAALQKFVEQGKGWVGIHAAGLTGRGFLAPGSQYWQWFEDLMGGVVYSPHPAYQKATLVVEDHQHPVTKGLPARLELSDEWYEFDKSPRGRVHILASVDESTYHPNKPMGDHPLVWINEAYRRMIYIGVGHDPALWSNDNYVALVRNAILWAHVDLSKPWLPMENGKVRFSGSGGTMIRMRDMAGTDSFKVMTGNGANYFRIRFHYLIRATDSGYTYQTTDYYEKPIEKGITNDYSKIEYRWWDFRQGHPWSSEDEPLFRGIVAGTNSFIKSLDSAFCRDAVFARVAVKPRFRVLALYEKGGNHIQFSGRARVWLDQLASDSNFRIDYLTNTDSINAGLLSRYQLIIQLDYAPYAWKPAAVAAFQDYIDQGRGGWVGFHHATLLGEFDGYPMWQWYYHFMGGIRWKDYIARFARATVRVEDHHSAIMKDVPDSFVIQKEEWYTYDKSPRPNVHVLARVDESTYSPDTTVKMGDHPVIWSNERVKAKNVYIFMGHSPVLFDDEVYKLIFRNAIFWAADKGEN
jgi:uncharacterized protein